MGKPSRFAPLLAALFFACSGGSATGPDPEAGGGNGATAGDPQPSEEELERRRVEDKLDQYQAAACERLCPRLTQCAMEDAQESMDPGELSDMQLEQLRGRHTDACLDKCNGNKMSLRQVEVFYECAGEESSCDELLTCLDQATPEKE